MKQMISSYYTHLAKGRTLVSLGRIDCINEAIKEFEQALDIKITKEVIMHLCDAAIKLNDLDLCEKYLLKAIDANILSAYHMLGLLYLNPQFKACDINKGIQYLSTGAYYSNIPSMIELYEVYKNGTANIEIDYLKAKSYLNKALEVNDPQYNGTIHNLLGDINLELGYFENAVEEYNKATKLGCSKAYTSLAMMYKTGQGVEQDINKYAEYLFKDLNVISAIEIGGLYLQNEYTPKDLLIAEEYFRYAANMKNPIGAIMYAAILISRPNYDEKQVMKALEIGFKYGANDKDSIEKYEFIEEYFDKKVGDKLKEIAEEYWQINKAEA